MQHRVELADQQATEQLALTLAQTLAPGDVVILTGDLGAGKTTFTQALARGLGITAPVTSPTFVIARHHQHPDHGINLVHVDAYRLTGQDELASLDVETWLADSVVVIEWGEGLAETLAESYVHITLQRPGAAPVSEGLITDFSDDDVDEPRNATITGYGPRWEGKQLV